MPKRVRAGMLAGPTRTQKCTALTVTPQIFKKIRKGGENKTVNKTLAVPWSAKEAACLSEHAYWLLKLVCPFCVTRLPLSR